MCALVEMFKYLGERGINWVKIAKIKLFVGFVKEVMARG